MSSIREFLVPIIAFALLLVTLIYNYLRNEAPSREGRAIYRYLVFSWAFLTLMYIVYSLQIFLLPLFGVGYSVQFNKISRAFTGLSIVFLFMFIGELYEIKKVKKFFTAIGWIVGLAFSILFIAWPASSFTIEEEIEVLPPSSLIFMGIIAMVIIGVTFVATILYFRNRTVKRELKRKVTYMSITYILFWTLQLFEAVELIEAVTFFEPLHAYGFTGLLIKFGVFFLAFLTIIIWAGFQQFKTALKGIFRV